MCRILYRLLVSLAGLAVRSGRSKDLEIIVLRHQLTVLHRLNNRTEGIKILKTPVRAPIANAFAERWIGTLRRELLGRTIIWNQRQFQRLVIDHIGHYNTHRPHRSLEQRPPRHTTPEPPTTTRLTTRWPFDSFERPAATASSTNTNMPPDQPRHDIGHPQAGC